MANKLKDSLEYNVADLRGIAGKLDDNPNEVWNVLQMARHVQDVAQSLENLVNNMQDYPEEM